MVRLLTVSDGRSTGRSTARLCSRQNIDVVLSLGIEALLLARQVGHRHRAAERVAGYRERHNRRIARRTRALDEPIVAVSSVQPRDGIAVDHNNFLSFSARVR